MASVEKRVSALERAAPRNPFSHLTDAELDSELQRLCIAATGTTLEQQIEMHGGFDGLLKAVREELLAPKTTEIECSPTA